MKANFLDEVEDVFDFKMAAVSLEQMLQQHDKEVSFGDFQYERFIRLTILVCCYQIEVEDLKDEILDRQKFLKFSKIPSLDTDQSLKRYTEIFNNLIKNPTLLEKINDTVNQPFFDSGRRVFYRGNIPYLYSGKTGRFYITFEDVVDALAIDIVPPPELDRELINGIKYHKGFISKGETEYLDSGESLEFVSQALADFGGPVALGAFLKYLGDKLLDWRKSQHRKVTVTYDKTTIEIQSKEDLSTALEILKAIKDSNPNASSKKTNPSMNKKKNGN
jgi:predicted DNA-binding protein